MGGRSGNAARSRGFFAAPLVGHGIALPSAGGTFRSGASLPNKFRCTAPEYPENKLCEPCCVDEPFLAACRHTRSHNLLVSAPGKQPYEGDVGEVGFTGKFTRGFQRGELIFTEGSVGRHMYVINSGGVDILKRIQSKDVLIGSLGVGEIFGEMALVDDLPRSATAVASAADTELVEIDHPHFVYLIGQQPAFALVVLKSLSLKLRAQQAAPGHSPGASGD